MLISKVLLSQIKRKCQIIRGTISLHVKTMNIPRHYDLKSVLTNVEFNPSVWSFDFFDTLVQRNAKTHQNAQIWIAATIADYLNGKGHCISQDQWLSARGQSEKALKDRSHTADKEILLEDIHKETLEKIGLNHCVNFQDTCAIEIENELSMLTTVPGAREALQYARTCNGKIIITSDMYHNKDFFIRAFNSLGLEQPDHWFISSEYGINKQSGRLFQRILEILKLHKSQIFHIGDNPWSDIIAAKKVGIKSAWITHRPKKGRPAFPQQNFKDGAYFFGREIIGPLLTAYVAKTAIVANSINTEKKRLSLAFIARDGWLLLKIFECINKHPRLQNLSIDNASYVHLSRLSVFPACIVNPIPDIIALSQVLSCENDVPRLLRCLDIADVLEPYKSQISSMENLIQFIDNNQEVQQKMLEKSLESRNLLCGYYNQHIKNDSTQQTQLVDLGWFGNIPYALSYANPEIKKLHVHYLGAGQRMWPLTKNSESVIIHPHLVDECHNTESHSDIYRYLRIIETVCAENTGTCTGYTKNNNEYSPRLASEISSVGSMEKIQNGVLDCAKSLIESKDEIYGIDQYLSDSHRKFAHFMKSPTPSVAKSLILEKHDVGMGKNMTHLVSDSLSPIQAIVSPKKFLEHTRNVVWVEGSLAASGFPFGKQLHRFWLALRKIQKTIKNARNKIRGDA